MADRASPTAGGTDPLRPPSPGAYREASSSSSSPSSGASAAAEPAADGPRPWPWRGRPASPEPPATDGAGRGFRRNTIFVGLAWAVGVFVLLQMIGLGILLAIDTDPSERAELTAALLTTFAVDLAALALVPIFVLGGGRRAREALGLRRPTWAVVGWGALGMGLAYLVLGVYLVLVDLLGVEALEPVSTIDEAVIYENIELVVLTGLLALVFAPIAEEIFHRGFMVGGFARRYGVVPAVLASGLVFGAAHVDLGSLIPFSLIGIVFALIYLRSRNLGAAMLAHFLFNAIAFGATLADRGVG